MSDNKEIQPIEGEIVEKAEAIGAELETDIREAAKRGGVFIGTLNIMTQPARNLLTEPLADLYKDRYEGKYKRPKHVFAFDMGLVALGAALAVVSIYFGLIYKPFETVQVGLTAEPNAPVSGGEIVLNLTVTNNGTDPIDDVNAVLKLPTQIKFERASLPYDRASQTVKFGEIDAKSDATVRVVGDLGGADGQNLRPSATVTYKDNSGGLAKKSAVASVKIAGSSVGAEFEMPENIVVGQIISGDIRYFNHGNAPVDNVIIIPNWPQNFVLSSSSPEIKNSMWFVGTLAPGSEGKISWSGMETAGGASADDFIVETGVRSGADILTQSQNKTVVTLIDPGISVAFDGALVARLGDMLALTATYKNTGDHTLNGAAVTATLDGGLSILNIDRATLGDINPGDTGTVKLTVRVDGKLPDALKNSTDIILGVRAGLMGKLDNNSAVAISSPAWNIKIASTLGMSAGARYWSDSGDQLGRGPLPPVVGKTTTLWIFWDVSNTTGAVNNVRITGKLPANVTYTGKAANPFGSAPLYDPATRVMTWNAGDVPAWPGVATDAIGAACEVTITPTADERNTYAPLMTDQVITGIDAATGLTLSATAPDMNTHLTTDPQGAATGTVK
jgi:uncharacterized repeat protein (TIGR01451 family)